MQKKLISLLLAVVLVLTMALPAYAKDVTAFGFDNNRQRRASGEGYLLKAGEGVKLEEFNTFWPIWETNNGDAYFVGKSYSQPLILSPDKFAGTGLGVSRPVVIIFAANRLYAFEVPGVDPTMPQEGRHWVVTDLLWGPIALPGGSFNEEPSASHPTYYEDSKGNKWIYVGTVDGKLAIVDLKGKVVRTVNLGGRRITSAPLVTEYMGQTVVVSGGGADGKVYVVTNLNRPQGADGYAWQIGGAVTSSPAPLYDNAGKIIGFAIASDGGTGSIRLFEFFKILRRDSNGWLVKTGDAAIKFTSGMAGIPASFAVEGKNIYFSDKKGNFYKLTYQYSSNGITNAKITKLPASAEFSHPNTFINRSPALDSKYVYFPIVDYKGQGRGMVVAVDKVTGRKAKTTKLFQSRAVTAPVILEDANLLLVGTEDGWISMHQLDYSANSALMPQVGARQIAVREYKNLPRAYAEGLCSEISVANGWLAVGGTLSANLAKERGEVFLIKLYETAPDFIIDKIDPGTSKAEPGKTYRGVIYARRAPILPGKDESEWGTGIVPVNIESHKKVTLKGNFDAKDAKSVLQGLQAIETLVKLQPGESVQIPFEWTAPMDKDTAIIRAEINPLEEIKYAFGETTTFRMYFERNYNNNAKMVTVPVELIDLIASKGSGKSQLKVGESGTYSVIVTSTSSTPITTDLVWRVNGKVVKSTQITVPAAGGKVTDSYTYTMPAENAGKTVTIEAEVNPNRNKPPKEKSFSNNKVSYAVEGEVIDLIAQQGEYNPALMVGESDYYSVVVKNAGDVPVTTDLVWRQNGKQIREISITIPAKGYKEDRIKFTMPHIKEGSTVKLEAEVNPYRNKPPKEKTFANNKATFPVECLGVDQRPQTGGGNPYLSK